MLIRRKKFYPAWMGFEKWTESRELVTVDSGVMSKQEKRTSSNNRVVFNEPKNIWRAKDNAYIELEMNSEVSNVQKSLKLINRIFCALQVNQYSQSPGFNDAQSVFELNNYVTREDRGSMMLHSQPVSFLPLSSDLQNKQRSILSHESWSKKHLESFHSTSETSLR